MHKSWDVSAEGFRDHVTTGGSLLGVPGRWRACGWSVVQLDHDEERGPMHGRYGTLDAEFEVQRTMGRAEFTAFLCLFRKVIGPTMVRVDSRGIFDGLWRGQVLCIGQKAKDADLWILIWEDVHRVNQEGIPVGGRARQKRIAPRRENGKCRASKNSSLKAMKKGR